MCHSLQQALYGVFFIENGKLYRNRWPLFQGTDFAAVFDGRLHPQIKDSGQQVMKAVEGQAGDHGKIEHSNETNQ
jgi:hypothetical protein